MTEDINVYFAYHRAEILYIKNYRKIESRGSKEIFCCNCLIEFKEGDLFVIDILFTMAVPGCNNILNEDKYYHNIINQNEKEVTI